MKASHLLLAYLSSILAVRLHACQHFLWRDCQSTRTFVSVRERQRVRARVYMRDDTQAHHHLHLLHPLAERQTLVVAAQKWCNSLELWALG